MNHKWAQNYTFGGKYNRLYQAQQLIETSRLIILLDRLEPVEDLTQATTYLNKFRLEK